MSQVAKSVLFVLTASVGLGACSGEPAGTDPGTGGTTALPVGGATASTAGGQGGGSSSSNGGVPASGGAAQSGGTSSTVGGATGGMSTSIGGAKASGGTGSSAGGAISGGATATGGRLQSSGGASTGGSATGGVVAIGGTAAGGVAAGGKAAGGTATGGAATGGAATGGSSSSCSVTPIDPNATQATKNLLCYLTSIYTKSVLSGQQEQSWDSDRTALFTYTYQQTGKYPAIWGGDYLYNGTAAQAKPYSNNGGIIMIRYHMGMPPNSDTYDNSKLSPANVNTFFTNVITAGTTENSSLNAKLDNMATQLKDLAVPVIMVPYHEVDQYAWFWWSKGSGAQFIALWKYTINYINVTKGVHNVLWTLGFGHDGAMAAYYPGKAYVDLGGIDEYDKGLQPFTAQWNSAKGVFGSTLPIPLHETGTIPQPADMWSKGATWLLWNVWCSYLNTVQESYTWNTPETIKSAYADSHTITRDEVPANVR